MIHEREFDALGRQVPRPFRFPSFIAGIPGLMERMRVVPARAIEEQGEVETLVACPCGAHPIVTAALKPCPGECERYYVAYGDHTFVAYGGIEPPTAVAQ